jgi:hypothetical protein
VSSILAAAAQRWYGLARTTFLSITTKAPTQMARGLVHRHHPIASFPRKPPDSTPHPPDAAVPSLLMLCHESRGTTRTATGDHDLYDCHRTLDEAPSPPISLN